MKFETQIEPVTCIVSYIVETQRFLFEFTQKPLFFCALTFIMNIYCLFLLLLGNLTYEKRIWTNLDFFLFLILSFYSKTKNSIKIVLLFLEELLISCSNKPLFGYLKKIQSMHFVYKSLQMI